MAKKLTEYDLTASLKHLSRILVSCQRVGIAQHRPLTDDEFLGIATAGGTQAGE